MRKKKEIQVEVEFTPGYEQRFTMEILKIYEKMRRKQDQEERERMTTGKSYSAGGSL